MKNINDGTIDAVLSNSNIGSVCLRIKSGEAYVNCFLSPKDAEDLACSLIEAVKSATGELDPEQLNRESVIFNEDGSLKSKNMTN